MDRLTPARRSWNMSMIRAKDTKPELLVRSALHKAGYRFRLHVKGLPGKPDIVLPRHRTVIFVHGCFWHRHKGCRYAYNPKTRKPFWQKKFRENVARDRRHQRELKKLGWKVVMVWECEVNDDATLLKFLIGIEKHLLGPCCQAERRQSPVTRGDPIKIDQAQRR